MTDDNTENDPAARASAADVEGKVESDLDREAAYRGIDADADAEVVRRDAGVRLRTNVQAGSASERAEVTLETHARDMAGLVQQIDSHRQVVATELTNAITDAKDANRDEVLDE